MKKKIRKQRKSKELVVAMKPEVMVPEEKWTREMDMYREIRRKAVAGDFMTIGDKKYALKSFWRKTQAYFGMSGQIIRRERITSETGYTWLYYVRVTSPDGRFWEAEGACSSNKPFFAKSGGTWKPAADVQEANIILMAQTVAFNRAISDRFGGEVSAEEMAGMLGPKVSSVKNLNLEREKPPEELEAAKKKLTGIWQKLMKMDEKRYSKAAWAELWKHRHYVYDEIVKVTEELGEELQALIDSAGLVQKDGGK